MFYLKPFMDRHSFIRTTTTRCLALLLLAGLTTPSVQAQLTTVPILTQANVQTVADAARSHAQANNWNVVIVVMDAAGDLLYLERMDGVQRGSLAIAQQKARTAARFRRPTRVFSEWLAGGNQAVLQIPDVISLEGGVPIVVDDHVTGAVGISGVTAQQDGQIAQAGINALLTQLGQR